MSDRRSDDEDARALSKMGYAQELLRGMGGFSSFALSFSIISVLTGIITTYDVAIGGAGPIALGLGWPITAAGALLVALAMAELASAFPTAGALYHWAALLGGPGLGWMTAMTNLAGQVAIVAAIDLGCARTACDVLGSGAVTPAFALILLTHGVINVISVRLVGWLNDLSASVHIVGVIVLAGALFAFGRAQPASFLGAMSSREEPWLGFAGSLALGMYTFTGFDASAHVSEETHDPARRAPWGIVSSVAVSAIAGFVLACALTLAIRGLPEVIAQQDPALFIVRGALGDGAGRAVMALAALAMWFCGLSSVTSASRTLFAFARDRGFPGWRSVRSVHPRTRTPHVAIALATLAPLALVLVTRAVSERALPAATSLATSALYVSYAIPVALGARARAAGRWRARGPWHLGKLGPIVAWLAVAWSAVVVSIFFLPANLPFGLVLCALVGGLALFYARFVRGRFAGPDVHLSALEQPRRP